MRTIGWMCLLAVGCVAGTESGSDDEKFFGASCRWEVSERAWEENECATELTYDPSAMFGAWRSPTALPVRYPGDSDTRIEDVQCLLYVAQPTGDVWLWNKYTDVVISLRCLGRGQLRLDGTLAELDGRSEAQLYGSLGGQSVIYQLALSPPGANGSVGLDLKRIGDAAEGEPLFIYGGMRPVAGFGPGASAESCLGAVSDAFSATPGGLDANASRAVGESFCDAGQFAAAFETVADLYELAPRRH